MSISEFFNKKARAVALASALAVGGIGGYAGYEVAHLYHQPAPSNFTLNNGPKDMTEEQFVYGTVKGQKADAGEIAARASFTQRIDGMAQEQQDYRGAVRDINDARAHAGNVVIATDIEKVIAQKDVRATQMHAALVGHAVDFVNDLRTSQNLSEQDYGSILKDYNSRVGLDVTAITGNYQKGIAFNQECQIGQAFGNIFGGDDQTAAEESADIGSCMADAQAHRNKVELGGGAAGGLLGAGLLAPLWLRRRNAGPKLNKSKQP